MSIGATLREARKGAGLTIDDVAARTRIQPAILGAIERDDFDRIPRGTVRRGFLRAYAREVGLEPESVIRAYLAEHETEPAPPPRLPASVPLQPTFRAAPWLWAAGAVALLVLLTYVGQEETPGEGGAVPAIGVPAGPPAGVPDVATAGLTDTSPEPAPIRWLTVDVQATDALWVEATADGERVLYRLVEAGEGLSLEARQELTIRVGNAAAFRYAINGVPGRPLGNSGQVVDLRLTRENFQDFQASAAR